MNIKEKLEEATIKALLGKLTEDNDTNKYYRDFSKKVKGVIQQLTHSTSTMDKRVKNTITIKMEQMHLIDRKDCQNYIQKRAKIPFTHKVDYEINRKHKEDNKYILNKEFEEAIDYVDNKYIPALKDYMDSHSKQCINLIQKTFKDNDIVIKDIKDSAGIDSLYQEYKYIHIRDIIDYILREWENPSDLYPYQHTYIITIDINDNKDTNVDDGGKYKVSYNANYSEYTVRDKKTGKVYYVSKNVDDAYRELDRLNNGGYRGSEIKPIS